MARTAEYLSEDDGDGWWRRGVPPGVASLLGELAGASSNDHATARRAGIKNTKGRGFVIGGAEPVKKPDFDRFFYLFSRKERF